MKQDGFTFSELIVAILVIAILLAVALPALSAARLASWTAHCAHNQQQIGVAWRMYTSDHDSFPFIPAQADWRYAGVRFSGVGNRAFMDYSRPLGAYLTNSWEGDGQINLFESPLDLGFTNADGTTGTGNRTAYRSFGTSYRANIFLLDATRAGIDTTRRPLRLAEVQVEPERMVVMGSPVWYEVLEQTGNTPDWYMEPDSGNLLFLDGSVRFEKITPFAYDGPIAFAPVPGKVQPPPSAKNLP